MDAVEKKRVRYVCQQLLDALGIVRRVTGTQDDAQVCTFFLCIFLILSHMG